MKKVLKKGFTLIELMVVIAIIGILATTLAPKLREQLAKAKDSKAVSFLGASRTVASSLMISHMTSADSDGKPTIDISWINLEKQMDVTTAGLMTGGHLIIGGSRPKDGAVQYGGTVDLKSMTSGGTVISVAGLTPAKSSGIREASDLHLVATSGGTQPTENYSTEGKLWTAY